MQLQESWIWAGEPQPNAYCYLRRRFEVADAVALARLRITADTSYQLWINGRFVGRGPGPFVNEVRPVDEHDVTGLLRTGANVICILGHWWGVTSHSRPKGRAGVLAELRWEDLSGGTGTVGTDESWRAMPSEAWERDVPRRSGAVAWTEYYDARRAPVGWTRADFDDTQWPLATPVDVPDRRLVPRMRPLLRESFERPSEIAGAWTATSHAPGAGDEPELTAFLDEEPLEPLPSDRRDQVTDALTGADPLELHADEGLAVTLDLGREVVGHLELDIEAPAGGRIDLCPAELLRHGRPWCLRKGCSYAQRYVTRAGRQRWQTFAWHGLRYLHVVLRGFDGPVTIHRLGVRRREADLDWRSRWHVTDGGADGMLNRIWEIGRHTLQVGTQEVHVDCPTREQAAYWGDATWIGLWTLWMTGDASHLRHLLLSAEPAQYEDGQLPASIFSSLGQVLFDYSLVMPWGLHAYWWNTGDLSVARHLDGTVERVLEWYRERRGDSGLVELDAVAAHERREGTLFIDHPGLGWHNFPHPGLDRRGISAGLNLFLLRALQCWSELLGEMGVAQRAAATAREARSLAELIEATFYDPQRGVYADALVEGQPSGQVSQQVNTLAILAGVCPPHRRREVLGGVLADDPEVCRCSPYFWLYQFEAMAMAGMHREMLAAIRELWGAMAHAGAATWWETFAGDELDSLCHPWSSAPNHILQKHFLGVQCAQPGFARAEIRPRPDLLPGVRGSVCTVRGEIQVWWEEVGGGSVSVEVRLPEGVAATLAAPEGWRFETGEEFVEVPDGAMLRALLSPF